MFHEEAANAAASLGLREERLTQTLKRNQLWNCQSDRQVEAAGQLPKSWAITWNRGRRPARSRPRRWTSTGAFALLTHLRHWPTNLLWCTPASPPECDSLGSPGVCARGEAP